MVDRRNGATLWHQRRGQASSDHTSIIGQRLLTRPRSGRILGGWRTRTCEVSRNEGWGFPDIELCNNTNNGGGNW